MEEEDNINEEIKDELISKRSEHLEDETIISQDTTSHVESTSQIFSEGKLGVLDDEIEFFKVSPIVPSRINSMFPINEAERKSRNKSTTVLITHENVPAAAIDKLKELYNVVILRSTDTQEEILNKVYGVDGIFFCSHALKLDKDMLDFIGDSLKVVALMSAGYDHVNVRQLVKRKIRIGNTKSVLTDSVAEVALCLALSVAHRFKEGHLSCMKGKWVTHEPDWLLGKQLSGAVCGIVGFGDIGSAIARRLVPFQVKRIIYSGHGRKQAAQESSAEFVEFVELLSESDFIFVTCPLTEETKHMFDYKAFQEVKPTCIFINIGRGAVVKTDDLVKALRERLLWGAGLDVTDPEPLPHDHPLLHLDNCFVSPHIGSATITTRDAMAMLTADNIIAALEGQPMPSEVCFKPDSTEDKKNSFDFRPPPRRTLGKHTLLNVSQMSAENNNKNLTSRIPGSGGVITDNGN